MLGGGARVLARGGCGKRRLRNERPPAALLFVRSRAASFRALQWVRGGLSGLSVDKVESGSGSAGRDVDCLRGGVKVFSALGALREGGGRRPPGRERREQPPSLSNLQRYRVWLWRRRAHAPLVRKRKVKERRAGATMGAPRGCPGAPCASLLRRQRGRTKAVAAAGRLWGRAGRWGLSGTGIAGSLPSVLRSCAFGAAPVLRAGSFSRPARGASSLRSRPERGTLRQIGSFCAPRASSGTDRSHLGVSLTSMPLASPLAFSQG